MKTQRLAVVLMMAAGVAVGLIVVEGLSSLLLFLGGVVTHREPSFQERLHTRYDEQLGWVNIPNVHVPDLYGPGLSFKTNAQGFRSDHDIVPGSPDDKLRVICSGDSFTVGYGVDNDHCWCQLLAAKDGRFEAVNMGQGGYGIDQAYLWYMRDGHRLGHAAHIFAVITSDFLRMPEKSFLGYGKPVLTLRNGGLVTENVPVPRRYWIPRLMRRLAGPVAKLRSVDLAGKIQARLFGRRASDGRVFDASTWAVAAKIFGSLKDVNEAANATLVVVYLPNRADYLGSESDRWREELHAESERSRFVYVDLVVPFRNLPPAEMKRLFIPEGSAGAGHYTVSGNEWVASALYERLLELPAIAARLASVRQ